MTGSGRPSCCPGISVVLAAVIGFWLGARAGWRAGSRLDQIATASTLTLYAMPELLARPDAAGRLLRQAGPVPHRRA